MIGLIEANSVLKNAYLSLINEELNNKKRKLQGKRIVCSKCRR